MYDLLKFHTLPSFTNMNLSLEWKNYEQTAIEVADEKSALTLR